ncbi:MAG TPA: NAD(P)-binding protein [Candidatus Limnocylindrales bacterium]|nr:NAD(P)-binding protein [Candidatus Limnocylindrales bacterium]
MTTPADPTDRGELDVAIVGAGAAGTYLADRLLQARPDWRIAIFERSNRIGGRLWSVKVDGLAHPIELGGMRYMSGHRLGPVGRRRARDRDAFIRSRRAARANLPPWHRRPRPGRSRRWPRL